MVNYSQPGSYELGNPDVYGSKLGAATPILVFFPANFLSMGDRCDAAFPPPAAFGQPHLM